MHMSMMYDYEKRCFLVEPVMAGLEGVVSGSRVNPNCLLAARSYHCVSGLIPRRQSCSASIVSLQMQMPEGSWVSSCWWSQGP